MPGKGGMGWFILGGGGPLGTGGGGGGTESAGGGGGANPPCGCNKMSECWPPAARKSEDLGNKDDVTSFDRNGS